MLFVIFAPSLVLGIGTWSRDRLLILVGGICILFAWAVLVLVWIDESATHIEREQRAFQAVDSAQQKLAAAQNEVRRQRGLISGSQLWQPPIRDLYILLANLIVTLERRNPSGRNGRCAHCGALLQGNSFNPQFHEAWCPRFNEILMFSGTLSDLLSKLILVKERRHTGAGEASHKEFYK